MQGLDDHAPAVKKTMPLFYLILTSDSIQDSSIRQARDAVREDVHIKNKKRLSDADTAGRDMADRQKRYS
ncbi:MAG: hypothetical protein IIZ53_01485 [Ruminococcus sp.]|nr:hypothetical protein [Ruminococcus sp.]